MGQDVASENNYLAGTCSSIFLGFYCNAPVVTPTIDHRQLVAGN